MLFFFLQPRDTVVHFDNVPNSCSLIAQPSWTCFVHRIGEVDKPYNDLVPEVNGFGNWTFGRDAVFSRRSIPSVMKHGSGNNGSNYYSDSLKRAPTLEPSGSET